MACASWKEDNAGEEETSDTRECVVGITELFRFNAHALQHRDEKIRKRGSTFVADMTSGISVTSNLAPSDSSFQMMAFVVRPLFNTSSEPRQSCKLLWGMKTDFACSSTL